MRLTSSSVRASSRTCPTLASSVSLTASNRASSALRSVISKIAPRSHGEGPSALRPLAQSQCRLLSACLTRNSTDRLPDCGALSSAARSLGTSSAKIVRSHAARVGSAVARHTQTAWPPAGRNSMCPSSSPSRKCQCRSQPPPDGGAHRARAVLNVVGSSIAPLILHAGYRAFST